MCAVEEAWRFRTPSAVRRSRTYQFCIGGREADTTCSASSFAVTVAVIVMIMLVREHPKAAAVVGGVSGIAGLLLIFAGSYRSALCWGGGD